MHRKVKVLIASWLASRIETRTRRLRRALRDHQRAELRRIRAADRRARGLWLYAAWCCKEKEPMNCKTVVPLQPSSGVGEQANSLEKQLAEATRPSQEPGGSFPELGSRCTKNALTAPEHSGWKSCALGPTLRGASMARRADGGHA
jgi:hypothetical protein